MVNGIDVPAEEHLFALSNYIIGGALVDLNNRSNAIIIGKGLADKMLLTIGGVGGQWHK